jgi:cytochrome P450
MAVNIHGFIRATEDIDFLVKTTPENEQIILDVLSQLPEGAARELKPGEVSDYVVVRICDEFTVDLMAKACGVDYEDAKDLIAWIQVEDVLIPYASPKLLWKTKQTYREKDAIDRLFLRRLLEDRGEWPVD